MAEEILGGDILTFVDSRGTRRKGRVMMRSRKGGLHYTVMLLPASRHGTAACVDPEQIISVRKGKFRHGGLLYGLNPGRTRWTRVTRDNYFDAAQALHWYAADYHGGQTSELYEILSKLHYGPAPSENGPDTEDSMQIYAELEAGRSPGRLYEQIMEQYVRTRI